MRTNVSTLLRDFPKIRQAAFRGERVVIKTREGNLILTADLSEERNIIGSLKGQMALAADADLTMPTTGEAEWIR